VCCMCNWEELPPTFNIDFSLKITSVHHQLSVAAGVIVALGFSRGKSLCKTAGSGEKG